MQAPQPPAAHLCAAGSAAAAGQEQALEQQPRLLKDADSRIEQPAQRQALEAAPGPAATAAAEGDPQRQPGAATQAAPEGSLYPDGDEAAAAAEEEGEEYDEKLGAWLAGRLQRMQPGAELTIGSVQVLGKLLDEITVRVLEEAQRVSAGDTAASSSCPAADAGAAGATVAGQASAPEPAAAAAAAAAATGQLAGAGGERRSKQAQGNKASALTSLDIHKALKRVLPGEPSDNKLRPYLPAVTKQAWHLDKQSLKGIKRQKQAAGAVVPAAGPVAAAAEPAVGGAADGKQARQLAGGASDAAKENQQHQLFV